MYRFWLIGVLVSLCFDSFSQDSLVHLSSGYWDHQANFNIAAEYLSDNVFLGRKDSVVTPYYGLQIGYTFRNGLYLTAREDYTTAHKGRFDAGTIAAGYNFIQSKHWGGELFGEKYFYNSNSKSIRSQISAIIGGIACYENEWITPNMNIALAFGQKTDVIINPSLNHEFAFLKEHLTITPAVNFSFATMHFMDAYYLRLAKQEGNKKAEKSVLNSSKLNLKDMELEIPIAYQYKCWEFTLLPTWIIPQNPAKISVGTTTIIEKLSQVFTLQAGLKFHIRVNTKHTSTIRGKSSQ